MCQEISITAGMKGKGSAGDQFRLEAVDGGDDGGHGIDHQDTEDRNKKTVLEFVRPLLDDGIYQVHDADEQR